MELVIDVVSADLMSDDLLFADVVDGIATVFLGDLHGEFLSLFLLSSISNSELTVDIKLMVLLS